MKKKEPAEKGPSCSIHAQTLGVLRELMAEQKETFRKVNCWTIQDIRANFKPIQSLYGLGLLFVYQVFTW